MASERTGHLLQPSALVNEAFLRLMSGSPLAWKNRTHFFASSARLMRQILVDFARTQIAAKRGNRMPHLDLQAAEGLPAAPMAWDVLDVNKALEKLANIGIQKPAGCQTAL
jgi:hypothetical protein